MVALAHFGQVPPMGIHILALLRFSLAYHPFHTRCDAHSLPLLSFRFLFPCFFLSLAAILFSSFTRALRVYVRGNDKNDTRDDDAAHRPADGDVL